MSGGGVGNVLSTGASLAAGQSPMGAFGSALGSQLLSGGGGGSGAGAPAGGIGGIGRQNQTQLVGPMAGVNPASPAYNIMMQQQQPRPQVLPQVTPQVTPQVPMQTSQLGSQIQSLLNTPGQVGQLGGMPALRRDPQVAELIRQGNMQGAMDLQDSLAIKNGVDIAPRPFAGQGNDLRSGFDPVPFRGGMGLGGVGQVQQALGGFPGRLGGAPDLSQDAYRQHLATALYRSQADIPSYDQWVQQRSAPKPMPQVFPQKPGVPGFGLSTAMQPYFQELAQQAVQQPLVSLPRPQVFPQKPGLSTTMQPRPQVSPPNPGLGLAGLANMLRGRQ